MNRRLKLIKCSLKNRSINGSFKSWLFTCFGPTCTILAKWKIIDVVDVKEYHKIRLKKEKECLYVDKRIPIESIYQTIVEQMYDWQWHYYQIPETKVKSNDIVLDCGCAEGIFTFLCYRNAKHIFVFEPLPEYLSGLEKTFEGTNSVTIVKSALGDKMGIAYLERNGISSHITTEKTDTIVQMDTIDNFCKQNGLRYSYLKADLEGYEINLLKGASDTIKQFKPKIAITTYHKANDVEEIRSFLLNLNPDYHILLKGMYEEKNGDFIMLHAW